MVVKLHKMGTKMHPMVQAATASDWFRGEPATSATDAEIADGFRHQPAAATVEVSSYSDPGASASIGRCQ